MATEEIKQSFRRVAEEVVARVGEEGISREQLCKRVLRRLTDEFHAGLPSDEEITEILVKAGLKTREGKPAIIYYKEAIS